MANLLSKPSLTQASALAEVYVVWDQKDYRMTLGTLISLVTKASLGLDRVNNTNDAEKPISEAVALALTAKANSDAVPTKAAFDELAASLENYATQAELNTAIESIVQSLNSYTTDSELAVAIETALAPVIQSLTQFSQDLQGSADRIEALELKTTNIVNGTQLNQAMGTAIQLAGEAADAGDAEVVTYVDEKLSLVQQTLATLTQAYGAHTHSAIQIEGLQVFVQNMINDTLIIAPNEW